MQPLYMTDSYLKEFAASVSKTEGAVVFLDKTAFYPQGGGQPCDMGTMECNGRVLNVVNVTKKDGDIAHHLDGELKEGDKVHCKIDWNRRYRLMRMHTAAHIIDAILYRETGALCTGNQLGIDKSRIDFSLDSGMEKMKAYIDMANDAVEQGIVVKIYSLQRDEAMKIPGIVKLAAAAPPNVAELRIVEIPGVDIQADGGTQVANTKEIGKIEFLGTENKGKSNRRLYYTLSEL